MIIGNRNFETVGRTYIMGILNVTPDSFSDGGEHNDLDAALRHTEKMISEGADIIDVGGESTRPGHEMVSDEEEIERTAPVVEKIKTEFDIPVSIDTYKSAVAAEAVRSGADLINSVWGLSFDERLGREIAESGKVCCLMHNRTELVSPLKDFAAEVAKDMEEQLRLAREAGIADDKIILDPGVGFGKTYEQNLQTLAHPNFIMPAGYPVLLGTSRKSVIGLTLDLPTNERVEGTLVTSVLAVQQGSMFVRVHDVKENYRAIRMMEAIRDSIK